MSQQSVHEVVTKLGLNQIRLINEIKNSDDIPLAQAADVVAYSANRMTLMLNSHIDFDHKWPVMGIDTNPATLIANRVWDDHPYTKSLHAQLILQYAIFREAARTTKDDKELYRMIVSNDEFAERMVQNIVNKQRVSMFTDPTLSARD